MPSGDVGRPSWHKPVLVLAIILVVGQIIAFIVLRSGKKASVQQSDAGIVATVTLDAANETPTTTTPTTPTTTTPIPPTPIETPDAAVVDVTTPIDASIETPTTTPTTTAKTTEKKKLTRAELLAQQKKEREDKKREDDERRRAEQQQERERAERKKIEQERQAAEQAKAAAELERQKLATQKAEAEAAAAKAAAEKAQLEAAKTAVTPATPQGPDVLVLVLGPGTPSVSSDQIRNVYLGRTTVWPNGTTARPLNRPAGTLAARKFYGGILKMNAGAFAEHWSEIQLGGGGIAPGTVSSGKVTVAKVGATTGGFSYVMESELPENTNGVRLVRLK